MNIDLTPHEIDLCALALQRMRLEIDVDGNGKCTVMNDGQKQACRFTIKFIDALGEKFAAAFKEALDE